MSSTPHRKPASMKIDSAEAGRLYLRDVHSEFVEKADDAVAQRLAVRKVATSADKQSLR